MGGLVRALYACYADHITLLKRPAWRGVEMSVIRETKGRLSGTIVTYVGNTILNTNKTLSHTALSLGLTPAQAWEAYESKALNGYVSGDDKVILGTEETIGALAESVGYWRETGYIRKDIGIDEPSRIIRRFQEIDFCSHRPIWVWFRVGTGRSGKWMPARPQTEILAKAVYSVGRFLDMEATAAHALQLRNFLVQYAYFRDIRRLLQSLTRCLPVNIEPQGKMAKQIGRAHV